MKHIVASFSPMATSSFSKNSYMISLAIFSLLILSSQSKHIPPPPSSYSCFKHIIGFGDSLADTGNLRHLSISNPPLPFFLPPYGETFFHRPTGRCSDGRLIIDFIAQYLGLPLVPPFFKGKNSSGGGSVNFAVAGATALPDSFFFCRGVEVRQPNISLGNQLRWFKEFFLPKFYRKTSDRQMFLNASIVMVGEIGGNDYNHALLEGKSNDLVLTFVPPVIKAISSTIRELIKVGAATLVVPGNLPIGCSAAYLTHFKTFNQTDYNPKTGCLNWLNKFARYHNNMLKFELNHIRRKFPQTTIIYADYYNSAMRFYLHPDKYGFAKGGLAACCPKCGPYKVDDTALVAGGGAKACEDPSEYVSWDGLHLTEAAYGVITEGLMQESLTRPQIRSFCAKLYN